MQKILKFANDNHWYLIAAIILAGVCFWTYGCESSVSGLLNPNQQINRAELENELNYIIGQAKIKAETLDQQDAVKQALLDAALVVGTTGQVNPAGLLSLAGTIGAVSFGLNRNQKYKAEAAKNP